MHTAAYNTIFKNAQINLDATYCTMFLVIESIV